MCVLCTADPLFLPKDYDDKARWSQPINGHDNAQATSIKMDKVDEPQIARCCSHVSSTCKRSIIRNLSNSAELLRTTLVLELEDPTGTFKSIRLLTPEVNLRSVALSPTSLHSTDMKLGKLNVRTSIEHEAVPIDYRSSQLALPNKSHCCQCSGYPLQKQHLHFEPKGLATHKQLEPDNLHDKTTQVRPGLSQFDSISSIQPLLLTDVPSQPNANLFTRPTAGTTATAVLVSKQEANDSHCVKRDPPMIASLTNSKEQALHVDLSTADKLTQIMGSLVVENLPVSLATITPLDQIDCVRTGHESETTSQSVCCDKHSPPGHRVTGSSEGFISNANEPINCRNLTEFPYNDNAPESWHCKNLWSKRHMPHLLSKGGSLDSEPDYSNVNSLWGNHELCSTDESHRSSVRTYLRWKRMLWMDVLGRGPNKCASTLSTIPSPAVSELLRSPSSLMSNREQSVTDPKSHALTTTEETSLSTRTTITTSSTCSTTISATFNDPSQMTVSIPIANCTRYVLNYYDESGVRDSEAVFFVEIWDREQATKN
ncbi:hypothetical protein P879_07198 [Paragonimus westermani]|uniref:Uncharacterized protein n=1 Tax=Paragonimus westermani TaxID=34504 RepID=A0A8T0DIG4_9TREM|nr:hypothetical protein P879_07198 [Paragonimus westermani]